MSPNDIEKMQQEIDHIQAVYREWLALLPKLEAAQKDWQRGEEMIRQLSAFYFDGNYMSCYEAIEGGANIRAKTEGEYNIMGEDTLWDAFNQQSDMAWQRLHSSIAVLDPKNKQK